MSQPDLLILRHPIRSQITEIEGDDAHLEEKGSLRQDIVFFLVSYACAFIILYGFFF